MIILDDFLPKEYEEEIKNCLYGEMFPWYYVDDVTCPTNYPKKPALSHVFLDENYVDGDFYELVKRIPFFALKKINKNFDISNVSFSRSFLQFPTNTNSVDMFHVDQPHPHVVFLYYVNDSDGDTIILDRGYKGFEENIRLEENNIIQKVSPKQGRIVIFDGSLYHSAEQPTENIRCVINFNLKDFSI